MPDRITYIGHATVSIELGGTRLLTDPALRDRILHIRRHSAPVPAEAVAGVEAVLVSHLHPDHLDLRSLRRLDREAEFLVPKGGGGLVRRRGFHKVKELLPGDATRVGSVEVIATRAEHNGRRYPIGRRVKALGYDLRGPEHRVYFAGDTDLFPEMRELAGGVDVALLPIAGWGPTVRLGHLDPRRAARAAALIQPRIVVPIHWGTLLRAGLAASQPELLTDPPGELVEQIAAIAPGVEVRVLRPGESLDL